MLTVIAATVTQSLLMAAPCPPRPLSTHCSIQSTARSRAPRPIGAPDRTLRPYSTPVGSTAPPRCRCSAPASAPVDDAGADEHTSRSAPLHRVADTPRTAGASPLDNRELSRGASQPRLVPGPGPTAMDESGMRRSITRGTREAFFKAQTDGSFASLDALATGYRLSKARTPSGHWKLTFFYTSFDTMFSSWPFQTQPRQGGGAGAVETWAKQAKPSPASGIVYAQMLLHDAIAASHPSAASKGAGPGSELFRTRTAKGLAYLEANKTRLSVDPHYYAVKLAFMKLAEPALAEVLEVVQEAGKRAPDYFPTYFAGMELATRLSQDPQKDVPALVETISRMAGIAEGESIYARLHWSLANEFGLGAIALASWPRMVRGMEDVALRFPDRWNLEHFAVFACAVDDVATAQSYLARIPKPFNMSIWGSEEYLNYCLALQPAERKP